MQSAEITALTIYPVKSMKGIEVEHARLTPHGLEHDRRYMVVRDNGRFQTQRDLPRLALVQTSLAGDGVELSMKRHGSITIPFASEDGDPVHTKIWGDVCEAVDLGDPVSGWLTSALESRNRLRLVRMAPGFVRPQGKTEALGEETHTYFADAAPFLLANEASLEVLNSELEARGHRQVPMDRFRPNIVVRGVKAFAEHQIAEFSSENYTIKLCHPCERCVVTTIDQATAEKDPGWQPFRTLRDINPVAGKKPAPAFGQNAILEHGNGAVVTRGDRLLHGR